MTTDGELPEPKREGWNVDAMWTRVRARTLDAGDGRADGRDLERAERVPRRWPRVLAMAASLIVIAGSAALIVRARLVAGTNAAPAAGEYSTPRGQYATIRLTDSSEVTLAPESHLTISSRFSRDAREVTLEGEAIFAVRHDAAHPFRVRARGALVEDIGTRFDLRAYPGDATVTVAVVEGSVSLGAAPRAQGGAAARGAASIVLASGEVGRLDANGHASSERGAAAGYVTWATGTLAFTDRPLPEVLRTIARWYDLDIRVTDARLARRSVTAQFKRHSATEMLDALAIAMDAKLERDGSVITLRPR